MEAPSALGLTQCRSCLSNLSPHSLLLRSPPPFACPHPVPSRKDKPLHLGRASWRISWMNHGPFLPTPPPNIAAGSQERILSGATLVSSLWCLSVLLV